MRVASDASIELARRLRSTGKSWQELTATERSREASLDLWRSTRPGRKHG